MPLRVVSHSLGDLDESFFDHAIRRDKRLQTFDRTGTGPDHPTLSNYPKSRYLKVL